jgi:hypothetical protein
MRKKCVYLKDENGNDVGIYPDKVTYLQQTIFGTVAKTDVNFVGGTFVTVLGSPEDVGNEIRMNR